MGIGKKITTVDMLQLTFVHLKLSGEIEWQWLTVFYPWIIIGLGGAALHLTYLMTQAIKGVHSDG